MGLNSLPDLPLVHLFSYLDPRQLLESRTVCSRWRDLALDRRVWRRTWFSYREDDEPLSGKILHTLLRLAPCIGKIWLAGLPPPISELLCTTECRVAHLELYHGFFDDTAGTILSILRNQLALGGLRQGLTLLFRFDIDLDMYAETLAFLCGIPCREMEILDFSQIIKWYDLPDDALPPPAQIRPSLRKLTYRGPSYDSGEGPYSDPFLSFLLTAHRSTLRELEISKYRFYSVPHEVLGGLERLEKLTCPLFPGMEKALVHCPKLTDLILGVSMYRCGRSARDALLWSGREFLSQALALKRLELKYSGKVPRLVTAALDLVEAAAASNQSQIETLVFYPSDHFSSQSWERLGGMLSGLRHLKELQVGLFRTTPPPVTFLRRLSPDTTPSLRLLRTQIGLGCPQAESQIRGLSGVTVAEYWEELRDLLQRLPGLHITSVQRNYSCRCVLKKGRDCLFDFASVVGYIAYLRCPNVGLYCHDIADKCDLHVSNGYADSWMLLS